MLITTTPAALAAVWAALGADQRPSADPRMTGYRQQATAILKDAARDGWVGMLETQTVLQASGIGVPTGDLLGTLNLFGVSSRAVSRRPRARATCVYGTDRVAAADLANVLLQVERLGFAADPAPLCEALRPALRTRAYLTNAELAVYWHDRERHRCEPLRIGTGPRLAGDRTMESLRTATGYRADLYRAEDGMPSDMVVTAPGRSARRSLPSRAA